jgi:hypothetical protein
MGPFVIPPPLYIRWYSRAYDREEIWLLDLAEMLQGADKRFNHWALR